MASLCGRRLTKQMSEISSEAELGEAQKFSYLSLQDATNNFSKHNLIGYDGFAQIYKGVLPNGTLVAVRKDHPDSKFVFAPPPAVEILSCIRHPNIVRVIGFCLEMEYPLIVSEYMSNGSLGDLLSNKEKREYVLNWPMRVAVCNGIARGLNHLHQQTNPCIIHRDIKPSNVLLNSNFSPKITGFDIAKLVYDDEEDDDGVVGKMGFADPEYIRTGKCTPKSDVYSFGVVMLEIISGRKPFQIQNSDEHTKLLSGWALYLLEKDRVLELVDPVLADFPVDQVLGFIHVALTCVKEESRLRPTMGEVLQMLNRVCDSPDRGDKEDELSRQTNQRNEISSEFGVAQRFDYRSLQIATTFFSNYNRIGQDASVKLFRGVLPSGTLIGVRKYDPETKMQVLFPYFVKIFSYIRHPNIDRVIGYCFHENYYLTVSEYVSSVSLSDLLIDKEKRESVFNWPMRVSVCKGIARGLHHLHQQSNPCVIHRDIKPENILLDCNFTPKITGFDMAKFISRSRIKEEDYDIVRGTVSYLDPEYIQTGKCKRKSDVYGFGVLMLEIISGRKTRELIDGECIHLVPWALDLLVKDRVLEVVDPVLADFSVDQVLGFMDVVFSCLEEESRLRPTMEVVIQMLNQVCSSFTPFEMQQPDTPYLSAASSFRSSVDSPSFLEGESSIEYTGIEQQDTGVKVSSSGNLVERLSKTTMVFERPSPVRGEYAAYARKKNMMPRNKA